MGGADDAGRDALFGGAAKRAQAAPQQQQQPVPDQGGSSWGGGEEEYGGYGGGSNQGYGAYADRQLTAEEEEEGKLPRSVYLCVYVRDGKLKLVKRTSKRRSSKFGS